MLLENINVNGTFLKPYYEAHNKYTTGVDRVTCHSVSTLRAYQCEFIQTTKSCYEIVGQLDYIYFVYCIVVHLEGTNRLLFAYIVLSFLVVSYTGLLCNIAYTKMAPSFFAVIRYINLSEHTTGAIILSTIYGLPSIITGYSFRLRNQDTLLFVNVIVGKDFYAKTLAVGVLLIYFPIRVYPRYLIRDILFYLPILYAFSEMMEISAPLNSFRSGFFLVGIWLLYVFVVLIDDFYYLKIYKGELDSQQKPVVHLNRPRILTEYKSANYKLFTQFFIKFNPLKIQKFHASQRLLQFIYFTCFPFTLIIDLVIPTVDFQDRRWGWSKLFNCINLITLPVVIMKLANFDIKYIMYGSVAATILAAIVFLTSRTDRPPKYHTIFAFISLSGSIVINYYLLNELISVLNTVGIMLRFKRGAMALLFHTTFDTLVSLVLGLTIAQSGYPILSYAFFRTIGLIEILGLGSTFLQVSIFLDQKSYAIRAGIYCQTAVCFALLETGATAISAICTNFHLRSSLGWFFLGLAAIFAIMVILIQIELMHPLGFDHTDEKKEILEESTWA